MIIKTNHFIQRCQERSLNLNDNELQKVCKHKSFMLKKNKVINIIAKKDKDDVILITAYEKREKKTFDYSYVRGEKRLSYGVKERLHKLKEEWIKIDQRENLLQYT